MDPDLNVGLRNIQYASLLPNAGARDPGKITKTLELFEDTAPSRLPHC